MVWEMIFPFEVRHQLQKLSFRELVFVSLMSLPGDHK